MNGWVHVRLYNPDSDLLEPGCQLLARQQGKPGRPLVIAEARGELVRFEGVDDRNAASALTLSILAMPASALPELDEEMTPESNFEAVKKALEAKPRFKVRRQVTLALVSFSKLLMYRDLAPENWPKGTGPERHPRVLELLGHRQPQATQVVGEYRLDELEASGRLPGVVLDADSSQHSAIVDVLAGKNLVLEGPPGTGKSQTIANLIAAALAATREGYYAECAHIVAAAHDAHKGGNSVTVQAHR